MMTKKAFLCGMGLGLVVGTYLMKHCRAASGAFDTAESNIKCKVADMKQKMQQKNEPQPQPQDFGQI